MRALEFGELAAFGGVVGKLVIGERGAWDDEFTWDFFCIPISELAVLTVL